MSEQRTAELRWPPERFFWVLVDAPAWRRSGQLPWGLLAEVADDLPVPIEGLHAVGTPTTGDRVVVCAVVRDALDDLGSEVISLIPNCVPQCVDACVEPESLQLLVGDYEPAIKRRQRLKQQSLIALCLVACVQLVSVGLVRRSEHWRATADAARQVRHGLASRVAPTLPPGRLEFEVARLRSIAGSTSKHSPRDAGATLAALLDRWPQVNSATPHALAISDSGISVSVSVLGDPAAFLAALQAPDGWVLDDPRLNASSGLTRLTLEMHRAAGDGP